MKEAIIRSLQGLSTPAEQEALAAWRRAAPENEALYRELEVVWQATADPATDERVNRPSARDIVRAAGRAQTATVIPLSAARTPPRIPRAAWSVAAAAVLVIAIGLAYLRSPAPIDGASFAAIEIITGPAEMVTTRLSDGTTVRVAPESRLLVRPGPGTREVWLDGHAFFAVAHDPDRPFTVRTRVGDAVVLGTRFDIRVQDQEVRVAVVEGRVALSAQGQRVEVAAGEISRAVEGSAPRVEATSDLLPLLAWMDGFLVFQDTPLAVAAREIEVRFGIRVLVPDPDVGRRTVSAHFTTEQPDQVLSIVCRAAGAHCTFTDSVASIEP